MAVTTAETSEFSTGPGLLGIVSFRMPGKSISSAKSHAQLLACYRAWDFISGFLASIVVDSGLPNKRITWAEREVTNGY